MQLATCGHGHLDVQLSKRAILDCHRPGAVLKVGLRQQYCVLDLRIARLTMTRPPASAAPQASGLRPQASCPERRVIFTLFVSNSKYLLSTLLHNHRLALIQVSCHPDSSRQLRSRSEARIKRVSEQATAEFRRGASDGWIHGWTGLGKKVRVSGPGAVQYLAIHHNRHHAKHWVWIHPHLQYYSDHIASKWAAALGPSQHACDVHNSALTCLPSRLALASTQGRHAAQAARVQLYGPAES